MCLLALLISVFSKQKAQILGTALPKPQLPAIQAPPQPINQLQNQNVAHSDSHQNQFQFNQHQPQQNLATTINPNNTHPQNQFGSSLNSIQPQTHSNSPNFNIVQNASHSLTANNLPNQLNNNIQNNQQQQQQQQASNQAISSQSQINNSYFAASAVNQNANHLVQQTNTIQQHQIQQQFQPPIQTNTLPQQQQQHQIQLQQINVLQQFQTNTPPQQQIQSHQTNTPPQQQIQPQQIQSYQTNTVPQQQIQSHQTNTPPQQQIQSQQTNTVPQLQIQSQQTNTPPQQIQQNKIGFSSSPPKQVIPQQSMPPNTTNLFKSIVKNSSDPSADISASQQKLSQNFQFQNGNATTNANNNINKTNTTTLSLNKNLSNNNFTVNNATNNLNNLQQRTLNPNIQPAGYESIDNNNGSNYQSNNAFHSSNSNPQIGKRTFDDVNASNSNVQFDNYSFQEVQNPNQNVLHVDKKQRLEIVK